MAIYLVTWNLNKEGTHYAQARQNFLNRFAGLDCKYAGARLDTVIFVNTTSNATQLYNYLAPALDKNDRIYVGRVDKADSYYWLDQDTVNWIAARS